MAVATVQEALGGCYVREKEIRIGNAPLLEVAYGWADTAPLVEAVGQGGPVTPLERPIGGHPESVLFACTAGSRAYGTAVTSSGCLDTSIEFALSITTASMAGRTLAEGLVEGRIGIKKLFYVLRPLFACRWIETHGSQLPTPFGLLVDSECVTAEEKSWIADLLVRKSELDEAEPIALDAWRAERLRAELDAIKVRASLSTVSRACTHETADLDRLFRAFLRSGEA
jgi:predicted nucleotidyltransferase